MSKRGENIYERKDGRWEARILGETGRYKYFYGKSYSEVKAKKNNWIKGNSQKKQSSETGLISDKLQKWLKECYGQVKNTTYESYYYCMAKHIIPYFKKNKAVKLTEIEANEFKMYIYNNTDLSQSYKHKILQVFKTALKNILDKNESTQVIINALKFPKSSKKYNIVEAFSVYEQRQIEKLLTKNKSNKDIGLLICFYTGLRLGELCALSWEDVDFDLKMLNIDKTLIRTRNFDEKEKKTRLICTSPKSRNSVRKIPFPDFLEDMLFRLFEKAKSNKSFILSNSAVPMDPRTIQRHHEKVLKAAGLEHRKFHVIRHTFATRALEIGIDITTLSDLLGHSSVSTTLNIYTHSLLEQKKLAISKMNALHTKKMKIVSSGYAVKKAVKK